MFEDKPEKLRIDIRKTFPADSLAESVWLAALTGLLGETQRRQETAKGEVERARQGSEFAIPGVPETHKALLFALFDQFEWNSTAFTLREFATLKRCSMPTARQALRSLIERKILTESGTVDPMGRSGKPAKLYRFTSDGSLAVEVEIDKIRAAERAKSPTPVPVIEPVKEDVNAILDRILAQKTE